MFVINRQRLFLFAICALLLSSVCPGESHGDSAVIQIQYRRASEILPIIHPFLSSGGVATVDERTNSLIIIDSAESIKKLEDLLKHFDQPVKRARIRIRFYEDQSARDQDLSVNGRVSGEKWGISAGDKNQDGVDIRISDTTGQSRQASEYSVQTTSGGTAYILTGKEIPYRATWRRYCQGDAACPDSVSYQKADSGMEVKAIIVGDRANVEITPRLSYLEPNGRQGVVRYSAAATQLSVPLGQWVTIGGSDKKSSEVFREIIGGGSDSRQSSFSIMMMVETVD